MIRYHLLLLLALIKTVHGGQDIAANEKLAQQACIEYARAQELYHRTDCNGDGILEYAHALHGGKNRRPAVPGPVTPVKAAPEELAQIDALITKLGADEFETRTAAVTALLKIGPTALEKVEAAKRTQKDPEILASCAKLIEAYNKVLNPPKAADMAMGLRVTISADGSERNIELVSEALAEAECPIGADPKTLTAKSGYLFRVLTRQGPNAMGGAREFLKDGKMTLGYGLLAFPKEHGVTGFKCYIISNSGTIFESTFAHDKATTEAYVKECDSFDPDPRLWVPSE
ncbi:MAG TPA: DUF2950 family protein [Planctomycetota bacterium]|nr:DUF2950 family protein [Planctomycetota bacterium]